MDIENLIDISDSMIDNVNYLNEICVGYKEDEDYDYGDIQTALMYDYSDIQTALMAVEDDIERFNRGL